MSALIRFLVCLLIIFSSLGISAEESFPSAEKSAFDSAAYALIDYRKSGTLDDSEMKWSQSLKILAMSKSKEADILLAQLGLFSVDGAFSEEFSCAATKRGKELAVRLRRQLKSFDSNNVCAKMADKEGVTADKLCATKKEFAKLVTRYRHLPLEDKEGACSY